MTKNNINLKKWLQEKIPNLGNLNKIENKTKQKNNNHSPRPPEIWGRVVSPTIRTLEHSFFTH